MWKKEQSKKESEKSLILVNEHVFNRIKSEIDNAVAKNKGPKVDGKKFTCIPLQHFLQNIANGKLNNREKAK